MAEDQTIFVNRDDAGRLLGEELLHLHVNGDIVLAIPRGGVPVGIAVARLLHLPLKLYLARKIGHPANNEYAIGAVSENDLLLNNTEEPEKSYIERNIKKERLRISEMKRKFGRTANPNDLLGKNVIIVDDGIATGTCMQLAIKESKKSGAKTITVAVPVCPSATEEKIRPLANKTITLLRPIHFTGIGAYYQDFSQLTDTEVIDLLKKVSDPVDHMTK